jgi:hypothetical protein
MNKYNVGQLVSDRINPAQRFLITRYFGGIYYVKNINYRHLKKELVYLENDIAEVPETSEDQNKLSTNNIFMLPFQSLARLWRF